MPPYEIHYISVERPEGIDRYPVLRNIGYDRFVEVYPRLWSQLRRNSQGELTLDHLEVEEKNHHAEELSRLVKEQSYQVEEPSCQVEESSCQVKEQHHESAASESLSENPLEETPKPLAPKDQHTHRGLLRQVSSYLLSNPTLTNISTYVGDRWHKNPVDANLQPSDIEMKGTWVDLTEEQEQKISNWVERGHEGETEPTKPSESATVTADRLFSMEGASIDMIERIIRYRGPPPTPTPSISGYEESEDVAPEDEKLEDEGLDDKGPEDEEPEDEDAWISDSEDEAEEVIQPVRKNLTMFLGADDKTGLHLVKDPHTSTYHDPATNLSTIYNEPLVLSATLTSEELEQYKRPAFAVGRSSDAAGFLPAPRTHSKASHSVVLFLRSRGMDINQIGAEISIIESEFRYDCDSRYYKGIFIPEYHAMTMETVTQLQKVAPEFLPDWYFPGALKQDGKPYSQEEINLELRERWADIDYLVQSVIENHMYYRLCNGYIPDDNEFVNLPADTAIKFFERRKAERDGEMTENPNDGSNALEGKLAAFELE
ncbi:hypothetical protein N431DRAFT_478983 [Stipitochalara longipes BDJ]|nr:hypothetical protein N431DRAFT_478983 [Stipitochalara longipes BDJ]